MDVIQVVCRHNTDRQLKVGLDILLRFSLRHFLGFDKDKGGVKKKCMYQHQMCSFTLSTKMATCDMMRMNPSHSFPASSNSS